MKWWLFHYTLKYTMSEECLLYVSQKMQMKMYFLTTLTVSHSIQTENKIQNCDTICNTNHNIIFFISF